MRFKNETEAAFWRYVYGACINSESTGYEDESAESADKALELYRERMQ